jgi:hypothetical protein
MLLVMLLRHEVSYTADNVWDGYLHGGQVLVGVLVAT